MTEPQLCPGCGDSVEAGEMHFCNKRLVDGARKMWELVVASALNGRVMHMNTEPVTYMVENAADLADLAVVEWGKRFDPTLPVAGKGKP